MKKPVALRWRHGLRRNHLFLLILRNSFVCGFNISDWTQSFLVPLRNISIEIRDCLCISFLILSDFRQINQLLFPWNHQKSYGFLIISSSEINFLKLINMIIFAQDWKQSLAKMKLILEIYLNILERGTSILKHPTCNLFSKWKRTVLETNKPQRTTNRNIFLPMLWYQDHVHY